ncbi:MAG TPA: sigma E positive regulator RseC/MucC [Porticoccaceae bacterium]|jgi:sigma-E factor negative regulatory protein RseC|nr:sigma E positive regulator RseC/MucC [Porticoccaceae bacterium]
MLLETGTVVSKTTHALMVETIKKSTCAHCSAASGCGHAVLSKFSTNTNQVRVLLGKFSTEDVGLGDDVTIGVPEYVVVQGALLIYMLPLILSISGAWISGYGVSGLEGDVSGIFGALMGFALGGFATRFWTRKTSGDEARNPVLIAVSE